MIITDEKELMHAKWEAKRWHDLGGIVFDVAVMLESFARINEKSLPAFDNMTVTGHRLTEASPLRESNILRRQLHPVLKRLGIPKCGLHAFRHGRVSFLVENNVSLPMIRLWIGHGSDRMVRRYTHARPEFHANEIAKLPSIANMQTKAA